MKIDKKDLVLLEALKANAREPLTQLAKKAHLSKENAHYRLKRLGAFTKFVAWINFSKIGYRYFSLSLKINRVDKTYNSVIKKLRDSPDVLWLSETSIYTENSHNIRALIVKKRKKDAEKMRYALREEPAVKEAKLTPIGYFSSYSKNLISGEQNHIKINVDEEATDLIKIDSVDGKILAALHKNCRKSNLEIANNVKVSSATVKNRIDRLVREGVIERFTVAVDYSNLGGKIHYVRAEKRERDFSGLACKLLLKHSNEVMHLTPWFFRSRHFYFRSLTEDDFIKGVYELNNMVAGVVKEETPNIRILKNYVW